MVNRFDVWLVGVGSDLKDQINRPAVVISPDELNIHLDTAIIAPLTRIIQNYPTRIDYSLGSTPGQVALEQIQTVSATRLVTKIATLPAETQAELLRGLSELFAG